MKRKVLNFLLIITSLLGYLEWGGDNHSFLFQAEGEILSKLFTDPASVSHPLILLPFAGQILLFITLFQKKPGKLLTFLGMGGLMTILGFLFVMGLFVLNFKIVVSTIPFLISSILTIVYYRKEKMEV
jgi:hypothetical protein